MPFSTPSERRPLSLPRVLAALSLLAAAPATAQSVAPKVAAPTETRQLQFVANRNQWAKPVLFATDVPGGRLFLERGRLLQALYDTKAVEELHHHKPDGKDHRIKAHAYSVTFVGANQQATVQGEAETGEISNYFLGKDQSKWATNVPSFGEVRYQGLYPGTNLRFYTNDKHLEYDFELAPGADAKLIKLRYEGQQKLSIVKGALQITTSVGNVVEQSPIAYQLVNGQKIGVPCEYALSKDNTLSFAFPKGYNRTQPLIIDPILVYSSYSGSSASNYGYTATYDAQGNLYAGGVVFGTGYPTTTGAYDVSFGGSQDYGIMKFNPTATTRAASRVYATYVGGASDDHPHSMVVDPAGNLVILGTTSSSDFPTTTGAYDRTFNSGADIVVSKLNPTGTQLLASTFFGGSGVDGQVTSSLDNNYNDTYRGDVTTDPQGNIYLATLTASTNFPAVNGFQTTKSGASDAVVAKFNSGLTGLTWSTFLGGSGEDAAYSVQVDSTGTVFVSGGTTSTNFPGTIGGLHPQYRGGSADGFVARLSSAGNDLFQASYIGTTAYDQAYFLQLDRQGDVYLFGQTDGTYPVTTGVYSNPGSPQFIHKLNRTLTSTLFSTVIGNGSTGNSNISPTAFLVDNCGQILLSGFGGNIANMPITPNAIQTSSTGSSGDFGYFYIMQLSANAGGLVYGTYFGNGSCHVDGGTSRFDKKGIIYQSMCVGSGSTTLPTTPNGWSATNSSSWNNAAFKIDVLQLDATFTPSNIPGGSRLRTGCAPLTVFFTRPSVSGTSTTWNFGNGQTSSSATPIVNTVYTTPGRYIVRLTVTDPSNCVQSATATDTIVVYGLPRAAAGPDKTICGGGSVTLSVPDAGPGVTYSWFPPLGLNTTTGRTVVASPAATTFYVVTASNINNCTGTDTVIVNVSPRPQVTAIASTPNEVVGAPVTFTASATGGTVSSYTWDFGDGTTGTGASATHSYTSAEPNGTTYQVRLTAKYGPDGGCEEVRTLTVLVRGIQKPNVITPNGDGKNDTFRPFLTFQPVNIQIFNRWGKKVFEQSNYTDGWGKSNVPGGVYYYLLESSTGETWKGWVEVVR
ncbi:gliding motility-associated C-terminal domain-containing protein [Microvirga sp. STR05]|uniref:Gliding motility-associated C-terminal domain-containing protein n=1 Tax=Hymenobacter duratus TaxID=2771356 RepID=A0ABR8JC65_9BACT|nr:PKD domain-containing protein [Hymenobacter duratus]MBD2713487.1 gliding motility-associated C-terminal domain-containing protein [Hymenobacter duratus]MBR7948389.1 gliding motility-associated C-terminal domain-containing protein [Microvirga sp. STR05]